MPFPPRRDAVTGQFAGVVAGVQVEKALVPPHVVHPVRDHYARARAAEIVVVDRDRPLRLDPTLTVVLVGVAKWTSHVAVSTLRDGP